MPGPVALTEAFGTIPGIAPTTAAVSNFFGGYAPEGNQLRAMAEQRHIKPDDLFGLLREFGGSIAGAVTFRALDEPKTYRPRYSEIDSRTLGRRLRQAVEQHDLGVQDDSRSMLPGFQPKLLLAQFGGNWYEPHGRAHSTHILKPRLVSRPHQIYNEYYAHELSRQMGLSTFASSIESVGQMTYLSIERFDRIVVGPKKVELVHQEDFAQAMGLDWKSESAKFQDPDAPKSKEHASAYRVAELAGSLRSNTEPVETWLRQLMFHLLIGDNDAHAKNVGLMHDESGAYLSQLYDAVPNLYQEGRVSWQLAMAVDGEFDHRKVTVDRIAKEARSWGVIAEQRIATIIEKSLADFESALSTVKVPKEVDIRLANSLRWNVERLRGGEEIGQPKTRRRMTLTKQPMRGRV